MLYVTTSNIEGKIVNVKIAFKKVDNNSLLSKLVGWWTKSNYSHVEIIIADTWISSLEFKGVHILPLRPLKNNWDYIDLGDMEFSIKHYEAIVTWIQQQENKKYDWTNIILSDVIPLQIGSDNRWTCDELITRILQLLGVQEVLDVKPNKMNPGKLAKIFKLE